MMNLLKKTPFRKGDSVRVKEGVMDADNPEVSLAGYQGRIVDMEEDEPDHFMVDIAWDSITLRDIPAAEIAEAEEDGLDWTQYRLGMEEVETVSARDSEEDVSSTLRELQDSYWKKLATRPNPTGDGVEVDIFAIDKHGGDESLFEAYQEALVEAFLESPEGKAYLEQDPDAGGWVSLFIEYTHNYAESTIPQLTVQEAQGILEDVFPRKVTIEPQQADEVVPELLVFWRFLKRMYNLRHANAMLEYLQRIQPRYRDIMNDESKFGMAKSFLMAGQAAGYDIHDQEDLNKFMLEYNRRMAAQLETEQTREESRLPFFGFGGGFDEYSSDDSRRNTPKTTSAQRKKKRKQAKASKKKNRKK